MSLHNRGFVRVSRCLLTLAVVVLPVCVANGQPLADHHQHLFSPALAALVSPAPPAAPFASITASDLIAQLDAAGIKRAAVLSNLALPTTRRAFEAMEVVARKRGIRLESFGITTSAESVDASFEALLRGAPEGLIVQPDPISGKHSAAIARLALKHGLPSVGGGRQFADDGGLLAYGSNFEEAWKLAARYVDKILKGAKPGDLPIEQPTKFDLVVNLKTARALGITMPASLLLRATRVIDSGK